MDEIDKGIPFETIVEKCETIGDVIKLKEELENDRLER